MTYWSIPNIGKNMMEWSWDCGRPICSTKYDNCPSNSDSGIGKLLTELLNKCLQCKTKFWSGLWCIDINLSFQRLCLGVRTMQHFIMLERPISSRPTFLWMDRLNCPLKRDCRINFLWARSMKSFSCPLRGISLYWKCESEKATSGWQGLQPTESFSHHCKACHSNWNILSHIPFL